MNLHPIFFLAQVKPDAPDPATIRDSLKSRQGPNHTDVVVILSCALGLAVVLLIWAGFVRKRPKAARGSLVVERRRKGSNGEDGQRKRRRRGESGERWGRNPTLGQTGGLPPPKPEEPLAESSLTETQTLSSAQVEPAPEREIPRIIRPS